MISRESFNIITKKYGSVSSWAVWDDEGDKPKSNMSNMEILDPDKNKKLLAMLNPCVIMIGLNFSRPVSFLKPYMNFHDNNPYANDFKIRFTFKDTPFYGAYMTDLFKNFPMLNSKNVEEYLKDNPNIIGESINIFRQELKDIKSHEPIIFAFGLQVYNYLNSYLDKNEYSRLLKLTHYSHQICKEKYKIDVHNKIYKYLDLHDNRSLGINDITNVIEIQYKKYIDNIGNNQNKDIEIVKLKEVLQLFLKYLDK